MIWRPFYFANLIVDPKNENRLYKPDLSLIVSTDGGASFSNIGAAPTATSTTCGSTPATPTTSSPGTTAASGIPTTPATSGGRPTTCRFRSSTTSAWTWTGPTTCTADYRTTA